MSDHAPGPERQPQRSRRRLSRFRDLPLKAKFALLLALCGGLTAVFASTAVLLIGWRIGEDGAQEQAREVARLSAHVLEAAVAFEDLPAIRDSLAVAATRRDLAGIWAWSRDGRLLQGRGGVAAVRPGHGSANLVRGRATASAPVLAGGTRVGDVTVELDLSDYRERLLIAGAVVLLSALAALMLSLLVSQWVARRVVRPIVALADAAASIAAGRAYERRLRSAGNDEVGRAVTAFNAMIDEVAQRGEALAEANRGLEARVAERTAELARETARAEAASLAKTRFLANMSHELRTPLNGVIGATQLLRDHGDDAPRRAELVDIIRSSGVNLQAMIDGVLDLARIESGGLKLDEVDFNLPDTVESVVATMAVAARQKALRLVCEIDPALAAWRHGDPVRLRQVLLNLLGNAIKFTHHGEVVLELSAAPELAGGVRLAVRDSGIGMDEAALGTAFQAFVQADERSTRRFGGSGVGLAICREVVDLMGGRIAVQSQPGRGSTFTVTLPFPAAAHAPAPPLPLGYRVALVEPHAASASALAALLRRIGCTPVRCADAGSVRAALAQVDGLGRAPWLLVATDDAASLELLEAAAADIDPQRVIGMDANESYAVEAAREHQRLARSVSKPVMRGSLVSRFGAVAERSAPVAQARDIDSRFGALAAGRVLVVEDDPVNQTIVAAMLAHAGYSVELAGDGASALRLMGEMHFDLVLMDWQMPDMDGLEVTRRLRAGAAGPRGRSTAIVALTANAFAEDRAACLAAGMDDFLTKPVVAETLIRTVNRWIGRALPAAPAGAG